MFTDEIKWVIGALLFFGLLIFAGVKLIPGSFFTNLFGSEKVGIAETPLAVKEIRNIGELISAEYYGEVIHSYQDGVLKANTTNIRKYYDSLQQHVDSILAEYENEIPPVVFAEVIVEDSPIAIAEAEREERREGNGLLARMREKKRKKQGAAASATTEPTRKEARQQRRIEKKVNARTKDVWQQVEEDPRIRHEASRQQYNLLRELAGYRSGQRKEFLTEIKNNDWETFIGVATRQEELNTKLEDLSGKGERIEVSYLGRGWVKAGYNLTNIEEGQYEKIGTTLYFYDQDPKLLNADINPWFIPPNEHFKEGSPGFEVLRAQIGKREISNVGLEAGKKNLSFEIIDSVKRGAKVDLIHDAMKRHILDSARASAERTLRELFALLQQDSAQQITQVVLQPSMWFTMRQAVLKPDFCIDTDDVTMMLQAFHKDTASTSVAAVRKERISQWKDFLAELETYTLCPIQDPTWYAWRNSVDTLSVQ